jgi:diguanylate cyclase (GGDEF)-like protein/PAS domain S-box-containing protein
MRAADTVPEFPVRPHGPAELSGDLGRPPPEEGDRIRQLVGLGDALAAALDANEPIHPALLRAAADLPAEAAAVWTPDVPSGPLRLRLHHHRRGTTLADRFARWPGPRTPELYLRMLDRVPGTLHHGQILWAPDLAALDDTALTAEERDLLEDLRGEHGLRTIALAPLLAGRRPGGLLAVAREGTPFRPQDLDFLEVLARRGGSALRTAHLLDRTRSHAALVETVSDAVIAIDPERRITTWNDSAERVHGIRREEALGRRLEEVLVEVTFEESDKDRVAERLRSVGVWRGRVRQLTCLGRAVESECSVDVHRDAAGRVRGYVTVSRDLTEVLAARTAVREQQRFTQDLMDALGCGTAVIDASGLVISANARWEAGVAERDRCVCGPAPEGANWLEGMAGTGDREVDRFCVRVREVLRGTRSTASLECRCRQAGPERATAIEVVTLDDVFHRAVVVQSDVTWRRQLQEELTHHLTHDELTGLLNRSALVERLRASVQALETGDQQLAVLFCDLDGFKDINDGLGHTVGDEVLVAVAQRLRYRCRSADTIARFGGDEFVVVLPVSTSSQARAAARCLVEALAEPIPVGSDEVAPGVSIGVTVVERAPEGDDPVETLLRDADTAMYHAKDHGRGRYEFFDSRMRMDVSSRLEYSAALRRAVGTDQLRLCFQTRCRCGDRRVTGVEALMRWSHPTFGEVPPSTFIPLAERTGWIVQVGGWALRAALAQMTDLEDRRLTLAVNVSPRQLAAPGLVDLVDSALAASGLEPWRLTLEITEGALMEDPDQARSVLTSLRRLGVAIALDDFGTGWSSLSYLRTLPVDVIKIDKTFVADLPRDPDSCAVVSAVLGLGHGMGLAVVAEGVEQEDQLDVLRDMGCDEYQGFIDGEPGPLLQAIETRTR